MIYRFGDFTLNVDQESLRRKGEPASIRGNAFQVLRLLVERAPSLVSRQDILTEVWGHDAISESSIPQVIKDIRKALEDSARTPRYVTTHYGRGYKFVAPVETDTSETPGDALQHKSRKSGLLPIFVSTVLLIIMIFLAIRWNPDTPKNSATNRATEKAWYLRAAPESDKDDLSGAFAAYLNFVIGSAEGGNNVSLARDEDVIPDDAHVLDVLLSVTPEDNKARGRFMLNVRSAEDDAQSGHATDHPVADSIADIFARLEVDEQTRIASGIVSQSPFATETLLRGMAALFAGELERAKTLFQACLEQDPKFDFARYELAIVERRLGQREKPGGVAGIAKPPELPILALSYSQRPGHSTARTGTL